MSQDIVKRLSGPKPEKKKEKRKTKRRINRIYKRYDHAASSDTDSGHSTLSIQQPPEEKDWKFWKTITGPDKAKNPINAQKIHLGTQELGCLSRIGFALFQNEVLDEKLKRLEALTEHLDNFTKEQFNYLRKQELRKEITLEELRLSQKLRHFVESFGAFAMKLHVASLRLNSTWALALRVPDARGSARNLHYTYNVNLDFSLHSHGRLKDHACKRIRISYDPDSDPEAIATMLPQAITDMKAMTNGGSICVKDKTFVVLPPCQRRSRPISSLLNESTFQNARAYKAWERDRASLLLSFANWMVLLWNTPWTSHACCCEIRFERLPGGEREYTFSATKRSDCHNLLSSHPKLLLLGIVLAELILATPLRILLKDSVSALHGRANAGSLGYRNLELPRLGSCLEQWQPYDDTQLGRSKGGWQPVAQEKILQDVQERSNFEVMKAVEYCLDHPSFAEGEQFRPDLLEHLIIKVLEPYASLNR
ncbi:hypothetical protein H2199_002703 [Coniosporium tulheliwenetii]|uniref:Uncharacterized protein n=1 Tax=Coniosporium tulheliwenetii TaxID=3383036 RepID=A0ACC2ZFT0_9PEZI|nr:hypothetical protein H2199_002703 [Cladosporium sp. JES 115]